MRPSMNVVCFALTLYGLPSPWGGQSLAAPAGQRSVTAVVVHTEAFEGGTLWTATADLALTKMVIVPQAGRDGIRVQDAVKSAGASVGINGGFFTREHTPTGLEVIAGHRRGRLATSQRLLVKGPDGWDVIHPSEFRADAAWDYVLQSGPILIERSGVLGIRHDGGPVARRSAVCVGPTSVTLAATDATITLYAWARTLWDHDHRRHFDCPVALNLDGGPSTGFYAEGGVPTLSEEWPVANVLVIQSR